MSRAHIDEEEKSPDTAPRTKDPGAEPTEEFTAASVRDLTRRAKEEQARAAEVEFAALAQRIAEVFDGFVESRLKPTVREEARHGYSSCSITFGDLHLDARPVRIGEQFVSELGQFLGMLSRFLESHEFALTRLDTSDASFTVAWCGNAA